MKLWQKIIGHETARYLFFGVLTTMVNYLVFGLCYNLTRMGAMAANTLAFIAAVVFAFVTNKRYVFESKSWAWPVLKREVPGFVGGRIASFLVEQAGLYLAESVFELGRYSLLGLDGIMLTKAALAVIVVVLNYIFGKLVFKKK